MRIALLCESDGVGGAERMMLHLARSLDSRGHAVDFIGPAQGTGWLGDQFRAAGLETHTFHLDRALDPRCLLGIARLIRRQQYDIIHSHLFAMAAYGTGASLLTGVPHLLTMHGLVGELDFWRRRVALRFALSRSASLVAVSADCRTKLVNAFGRTADRMEVVINGIPEFDGDPAPIRQELSLANGDPFIVSVGRQDRGKAQDLLLEALAGVSSAVRWRVALVGREGPNSERMRAIVAERGWSDRVHFLGERQDVSDILAAATVFVMPSRWEGLPLALLEAMFSGTAIIASRVGGIPEVVDHDREAVLVEPDDVVGLSSSLDSVLHDAALRNRLAAAAQERVRANYSVDAMTAAYERIYQTMTNR